MIEIVYHAAFAASLGKRIIVERINLEHNSVWGIDNKPKSYRVNRAGRTVVAYDPHCVQTVYGITQLKLEREGQ